MGGGLPSHNISLKICLKCYERDTRAENINFIIHMAAILDLFKLGSIPYLGFNKTFDMLFDVYM